MQCSAKSKRSGEQCKNDAMSNGKCRMHGGTALLGIAHPNFKHGRYSRHLPSRLAARYAEALSDPKLLELRDEIALTDARQTELLDRLGSGYSLQRWGAARTAYGDLMVAIGEKDSGALRRALVALEDALIAPHSGDDAVWNEVAVLTEQRRKLVESEQKRLAVAQQLISAEQAMTLIARLIEVVRTHVTDPTILAAIAAELTAITNAGAGQRTEQTG